MPRVVIIGGGCSGALTAVHLVRAGARVTVIERRAEIGPGLAYSTACGSHLLNVVAGRMGAFPEAPDHFRVWAERELGRVVAPTEFLPRSLYGRYLRATVAAEASLHSPGGLAHVRTDAVSLGRGSWGGQVVVGLADGGRIEADACVLALGHADPAVPRVLEGPGLGACPEFFGDPWGAGVFGDLDARAPVVLLGTGLTMLDMVLGLDDSGHRGPMVAVSRRGLVPRWHAIGPVEAVGMPVEAGRTGLEAAVMAVKAGDSPLEAARTLRAACATADWRSRIDALRPITPSVWGAWSDRQRASFLRHARPHWDVHRHRAAPAIGARIDAMIGEDRLRIVAGRIESWSRGAGGASVRVRVRGDGSIVEVGAARIINCTGPCTDIGRSSNALVRRLAEDGVIRGDGLRLGVETEADGRVIGADGVVRDRIWTVGPWRTASVWESVAVPELRVQARDVAGSIAGVCAGG